MIHHPKSRQRSPQSKPPVSEGVKGFYDAVSMVFSIVGKLASTAFIILIIIRIVQEYQSDDYFLEKFQISPEVSQHGFNENFFADNLAHEITRIKKESKSLTDVKEYISINSKPEVKAEVLGFNITVNQFVDFLLEHIGHKRKVIKGSVIKVEKSTWLHIHVHDHTTIKMVESKLPVDSAVDKLIQKAALEVIKITDPATAAYYYYKRGKKHYPTAMQLARNTIQVLPKESKWALNLIGKIYNETGLPDSAIAPLKAAIQLDKKFLSAYNNLGTAYLDVGKDSLALATFIQCNELDPEKSYKFSRYMLGRTYTRLKAYDDALRAYKESIAIDTAYLMAMNNMAFVYNLKGSSDPANYDSAFLILNKALMLPEAKEKKRGLLVSTLAETKFFVGDTTGFFTGVEEAIQLGHRFSKKDLEQPPYSFFSDKSKFSPKPK